MKTKKKSPANVPNYGSIKKAMENNKFNYRTIGGVAKEANVSVMVVHDAIKNHPKEMVLLHRKGKNGEVLVTTRDHYKKRASVRERLMGVIINRVY
jgi:hypothetical protein